MTDSSPSQPDRGHTAAKLPAEIGQNEREVEAPRGRRVEYEFSPAEEAVFAEVSRTMRLVSWIAIALGLLGVASGILELTAGMDREDMSPAFGLGAIIQGVILMVIGGWVGSAAESFSDIVTTCGTDISHLMTAVRYLRKIYRVHAWMIALAAVLLVAVVAILLRG
jgi:hypothetical protein